MAELLAAAAEAAAALPARIIFLWCEFARAAATARGYPTRRADRAAAAVGWLTLATVSGATPRVGDAFPVVGDGFSKQEG
jgi:hypothetical protein